MMTGGDHFLTPVQAPGNIELGGGEGEGEGRDGERERERVIESYEKKNQKVEKRAKTFATHCS